VRLRRRDQGFRVLEAGCAKMWRSSFRQSFTAWVKELRTEGLENLHEDGENGHREATGSASVFAS
jgi:hypothetical protein